MIDSIYWIWFQLVFGIGTRRAELMLNYFDEPLRIYDEIQAGGRALGMLREQELRNSAQALENAGEIQRRTQKKGVDIITPDHPAYPERLQNIYAKPAVLYVKGELACLKQALVIAMVGTRNHTEYGKEAACMLARGLAESGAVVVSGLAKGIDSHCHGAALEAGGKTVGVLGCGMDVDYPAGSAELKRAMCENGAIITEYPLGIAVRPSNFPQRNRILSGLAHGVVVVEANRKSGSLITASHALEQGRDVFAVPGSIFSECGQGTNQLLKEGARLVECVEDILGEYLHTGLVQPIKQPRKETTARPAQKAQTPRRERQPAAEGEPTPQRKPLPEEATPQARAVYEEMGAQPLTVEQLAGAVDADVGEILAALTELELFGLILGYPGRRFGLY